MLYLKKIFSFFTFFAALSINYSQDCNIVNYSLFLEKSVGFATIDTKIVDGVFKEGNGFTIPSAILPNSPIDFSAYQDLYNALVGGKFSIDYGALNNDLIMKIFIRNLDPNSGKYLNLGESSDTLFAYFEIRIWELPDSNFYPEETSYYFNEGFFARFSIPKSESLNNFLNILGIENNEELAFSYLEEKNNQDDWNAWGIQSIDDTDSIKFKAIHLSRIGGGRKRISSNIQPNDSILAVNLKSLSGIPTQLNLSQNYPNPFNPSTKIQYSIANSGNVKLDVYNIIGKHVLSLVNSYQTSGNYEVEFSTDALKNKLTSGIYIYTLKSNNYTISKKMVLMK